MLVPTSSKNADLRFKSPSLRTAADDAEIMRQSLGIKPEDWNASNATDTAGIDLETLKRALGLPSDATPQDMNAALLKVNAIRTGQPVDDTAPAGIQLDGDLLREVVGLPGATDDDVNSALDALAFTANPTKWRTLAATTPTGDLCFKTAASRTADEDAEFIRQRLGITPEQWARSLS